MKEACMKIMLIAFFWIGGSSLPLPGDPACRLDLSEFPYKPMGGCTTIPEKLENGNGFPVSRCCQNALLVFGHALALHAAKDSSGSIFIPLDQWRDCSGPFGVQPNVSIQTCGFDELFYGSGKCSTLQLQSIDKKVVDQCSHFGSSLFDEACGSCTSAIWNEVRRLLVGLGVVGSNEEEAVCSVAVVVSVLEGTMNRTSGIGSEDLIRCLPALATPSESKDYIKLKNSVAEPLLAVLLVVLGLTMITKLIKYTKRKREREEKMMEPQVLVNREVTTQCSGLYRFSRGEMEKAINYSVEKKFLGRGSAGNVFKGMLPSGQIIAIKHLFQGNTSDSFGREIDGLSRVRHPNLVCLLGCCMADEQQYLVYEYCPNGNLAHHLLKKECVLTWDLRVKILRDCAAALKYLHYHISGCIVHRDIKLTNILLTHDMQPKLSDFGLSKMLGMEESKVFTDVRGTIGYMDPEYMINAKLTCASDIYSFGIVTLQLLSGQRVIELDLNARDQLTRKARDVSMGRRALREFQDGRMNVEAINSVDFESVLQLAVLCTASSSRGRPTIDLVLEELERVWQNTQASSS